MSARRTKTRVTRFYKSMGTSEIHYLLPPTPIRRILRCIRLPYFFKYCLLMCLVYGVLARPGNLCICFIVLPILELLQALKLVKSGMFQSE